MQCNINSFFKEKINVSICDGADNFPDPIRKRILDIQEPWNENIEHTVH